MTHPTQHEAGDSVDEAGGVESETETELETLPMEQSAPPVAGGMLKNIAAPFGGHATTRYSRVYFHNRSMHYLP